jgi:hypothetical protein
MTKAQVTDIKQVSEDGKTIVSYLVKRYGADSVMVEKRHEVCETPEQAEYFASFIEDRE